jgi:hypothetical protein
MSFFIFSQEFFFIIIMLADKQLSFLINKMIQKKLDGAT